MRYSISPLIMRLALHYLILSKIYVITHLYSTGIVS